MNESERQSRKQNTTRVTHRPATYKEPIVANMESIKIEIRERTTITECRLLDILFCIFFFFFFFFPPRYSPGESNFKIGDWNQNEQREELNQSLPVIGISSTSPASE